MKPFSLSLFVSALSLASAQATAKQEISGVLVYICDSSMSHVMLETNYIKSDHDKNIVESIDIDPLIVLSKEDARGMQYRTGTKVIERNCGNLKVKISGGYLNSNPNGMLGAITFPLIEIFHKNEKLLKKVPFGVCSYGQANWGGYYDRLGKCPQDWFSSISAYGSDHSTPAVEGTHTYFEEVEVISNPSFKADSPYKRRP